MTGVQTCALPIWCVPSDSHHTSLSLETLSVSTGHNFLKRTDGEQKLFTPSGHIEEEKNEEIAYDHTQCCDCSVVDDLARDCIARLSVMHRKAAESFGRLEKLLQIREDLININMSVRAQKTFWSIPCCLFRFNSLSSTGGKWTLPLFLSHFMISTIVHIYRMTRFNFPNYSY